MIPIGDVHAPQMHEEDQLLYHIHLQDYQHKKVTYIIISIYSFRLLGDVWCCGFVGKRRILEQFL